MFAASLARLGIAKKSLSVDDLDVVRVGVILYRRAQRGSVGRSRLRAGCRGAQDTAAQERVAPIVFHVNHCESIG
jgi:hypothetical protein